MTPFRRFERTTGLFVVLLVVAFILATVDVRSQQGGMGELLRTGADALFSPVQRAVTWVTRPVVGFIDGLANIAALRDDNERLTRRVRELEAERADVVSLEAQIVELEAILDLDVPEQLAAVTARIYAFGPSEFDFVLGIDKGSNDGLLVGQPVVDENGLVGQLVAVTDDVARVRLITDPIMTVGVRNERTGGIGWVEGRGTDALRLRMFGNQAPVAEGDRLVTSGSAFPPDLVVGFVLRDAEADAGFELITEVEPVVQTGRLDFVKVLIGWDPLTGTFSDDEGTRPDPPGTPAEDGAQ